MRKQAGDHAAPIPPPAGRGGHVGGIESIMPDGVTGWFGFDYSGVSPLIDDIDAMACHASVHMLQRDGAHDVAYWRPLAEADPELCDDEAQRSVTRAGLARSMAQLRAAQADDVPTPDLEVGYHLRHLPGSAGDQGAGAGFEAADTHIAMLRGERPLPAGRRCADAARHLRADLDDLVTAAAGNRATGQPGKHVRDPEILTLTAQLPAGA